MELIEAIAKYGAFGAAAAVVAILAYSTLSKFGEDLHGLLKRHRWKVIFVGGGLFGIGSVTWAYYAVNRVLHPDDVVARFIHLRSVFSIAMTCAIVMELALFIICLGLAKVVWMLHLDLENFKASFRSPRKNP